jgi:ESCRT-II complex subunit VPS36
MARCEMCDSILGTVQLDRLSLNNSSESTLADSDLQHSRATTPAPPSSFPADSYIRLSFRKGGDKSFYFSLKKALQSKSWNTNGLKSGFEFVKPSARLEQEGSEQGQHENASYVSKPIGIDRILRTMDSQQQAHQTELTEGLQDLQALMAKAKEMVSSGDTCIHFFDHRKGFDQFPDNHKFNCFIAPRFNYPNLSTPN